ncbi:MAG: phosphate ABC transporter substrate-binding protein [Eggerthellaceae bacterium]|nr:phosphate ABC transporter substrate-binding protein [Eggerthellaceae bacterium]MCH4221364.1 phosphate ABC transporter substrate-binding protein [Eggerthellaceae bacterium]
MKKFRILVATFCAALMCVCVLGACSSTSTTQSSTSQNASDGFKSNIMFCGSTSLYPIMSSLASSFTDTNATWDKVDSSFPKDNVSIYVAPGGSGVGVSALKDGTCDYGMVARTLSDSEKQTLGDYTEYQVAKDALTVSVNAQNPLCDIVDNLDTDTIRAIFDGDLTTWNQVDPSLPDQKIQVYIRDLSGGAYEVFQKTIMGDKEVTSSATQSASMTELATNIANNPWAIGYAGYGAYTKANKSGAVLHAFKVNGVEPTVDTIKDGSYTIQRPVMFVGKGTPTDSEQAFINYVFSQKGYDVVEANGYIPAFTPGTVETSK